MVKVMSDVTYRIQKSSRSKPQVVHADRLKPYEGPQLQAWKYEAPVAVERVEDEEDGEETGRSEEKEVVEDNEAEGPAEEKGDEEDEETLQDRNADKRKVEEVRRDPPPEYSEGRRNPSRIRRRPSRYDS